MNNVVERRDRYMRDALPIRLGGLAANLAPVSSCVKNVANEDAVIGLLEESQYFIEWTALDTQIEFAAELVKMQLSLAVWNLRWKTNYMNKETQIEISRKATHFSDRVLLISGLFDSK